MYEEIIRTVHPAELRVALGPRICECNQSRPIWIGELPREWLSGALPREWLSVGVEPVLVDVVRESSMYDFSPASIAASGTTSSSA